MNLKQAMARLEAAGTEQNRKVYPRHGVRGPMFGVSYKDLDTLQKEIKVDDDLAHDLWATGNHDARVLATKVADPGALRAKDADAWVRDCDNYIEMEAVGSLVARAPIVEGRAARGATGRANGSRARAGSSPRGSSPTGRSTTPSASGCSS